MAPEAQGGNWLLEHGTATFADGRTVSLVDAYFEIDAVNARAATTQQDRGATITLRSELPQPALPAGAPVFAAGAAFNRPVETRSESAPVIDWTSSYSGVDDSAQKNKKGRTAKSWLADFLGWRGAAKEGDLAARTGLKVVLTQKEQDK
jgi:hypothetical protein